MTTAPRAAQARRQKTYPGTALRVLMSGHISRERDCPAVRSRIGDAPS